MKWSIVIALLLVATPSRAQEDDAVCQASYVAGQKHYKLEHDLIGGRDQLLVCARTCPDELRASCGKWLREINTELPSIIVVAKDARGKELADVDVDVDGTRVASFTAGRPIEVNPGKHVVRVQTRSKTAEENVVINAGEKLKTVEVWTEPRAIETTRVRRPTPVGAYVLLTIGAVSLASFATFGLWSTLEYSKTGGCAPSCDPANRDTSFDVKTVVADVSLGVASAALVSALVVYLTRPKIVEHVPATSFFVGPRGFGLTRAF